MKSFRRAAVTLATAGLVVGLTGTAAQAAVSDVPQTAATFNGTVFAIAKHGSTLYVGGSFTKATDSSGTVTRRHLAAVSARTGQLLPWKASTDGTVLALAYGHGKLFAGGTFGHAGVRTRSRLAAFSTRTGKVYLPFHHRVSGGKVSTLALTHKRLYAGGSFTAVDGKARGRLASFDRRSHALTSWAPVANDRVLALRISGGHIWVGGKFTSLNGRSVSPYLAALDPASARLTPFRSTVGRKVNDFLVTASRVYVAEAGFGGRLGAFTTSGTALWHRTFDGDVQALTLLDDTLYIGGHFGHQCETDALMPGNGDCVQTSDALHLQRFAAYRFGGARVDWDPHADSPVGVKAMRALPTLHKVAAGGAFTTVHGAAHQGFALFG